MVPVVSIVAGLVTSIDRGKRQPSPALSIGPVVSVVPIVAGLVSIDQGKRLDHPAAVPIVAGAW